MKRVVLTACFMFLTAVAFATDITTLTGDTYKNVKIMDVNPAGLVVEFPDGIRQLDFSILSDADKKKFGYDPKKAEEFKNKQANSENQWRIDQEKLQNAQISNERKQADANYNESVADLKKVAIEQEQEQQNIKQQQQQQQQEQQPNQNYSSSNYDYGDGGDWGGGIYPYYGGYNYYNYHNHWNPNWNNNHRLYTGNKGQYQPRNGPVNESHAGGGSSYHGGGGHSGGGGGHGGGGGGHGR